MLGVGHIAKSFSALGFPNYDPMRDWGSFAGNRKFRLGILDFCRAAIILLSMARRTGISAMIPFGPNNVTAMPLILRETVSSV